MTLISRTIVPWKEWYLQPVTEPKDFPVDLPCRRVGVNAFGYGGTNSHAILENHQSKDQLLRSYKSFYKAKVPDAVSKTPARPQVLVFSAHDVTTITRNIKAYSQVKHKPELVDLAYTLSERRSIFPIRAFAICHQDSIHSNILDALRTIRESLKPPTIGFVFTGNQQSTLLIIAQAYRRNRSRGTVAQDGLAIVRCLSIFYPHNPRT